MEKYNKKRKRLSEMSERHLRRLVQNKTINLFECNDQEEIRKNQEKLSENHTFPSRSANYENDHINEYVVNESDNHIEFICSQTGNDNMNIIHEFNEITNNTGNNAVYLDNPNTDNVKEERNFKFLLHNWAVINNVTHVALSQLLKILRTHECFLDLSVDSRSLLQTPKNTTIKTVLPGLYSHFGVRVALEKYNPKYNHRFHNMHTINIGESILMVFTSIKIFNIIIMANLRMCFTI